MPLNSRFKSFWTNSQTKIWSYIQGGAGAIVIALGQLNTYVTDPVVKDYINQLTLPHQVSVGLIVFGLITYVCHGHKED